MFKQRKSSNVKYIGVYFNSPRFCWLGIIANNNKPPEAGIDLNPAAVEAIQELEAVHRALEDMAREKAALVLELGNHQTELMALRSEVARLKVYIQPFS